MLLGLSYFLTVRYKTEKVLDAIRSRQAFQWHFLKLLFTFLLMGLLPLAYCHALRQYLHPPTASAKLYVVLGLLALLVTTIGIYTAKSNTQVELTNSHLAGNLVFYFPLRALHVAAYEIFFRGSFLPALLAFFSPAVSIVINTFFYALMHASSGKKELAGAVPLGIVLCYLTIVTQSVWPAVILHIFLALSFEIVAIHRVFAMARKKVEL